ncbi:hypothetical protein CC78DRAFT_581403 [Lojkania enalia]|uniref:Uncharacterized protein n=1 Tax=Lojkania enalia TaxID=147567 RepID=A0A9P4K6J7_9PLEO|nr:hypothetical protein CC78DRAFT_581403 [Didymosphaeria enalia]
MVEAAWRWRGVEEGTAFPHPSHALAPTPKPTPAPAPAQAQKHDGADASVVHSQWPPKPSHGRRAADTSYHGHFHPPIRGTPSSITSATRRATNQATGVAPAPLKPRRGGFADRAGSGTRTPSHGLAERAPVCTSFLHRRPRSARRNRFQNKTPCCAASAVLSKDAVKSCCTTYAFLSTDRGANIHFSGCPPTPNQLGL